MPSSPTCGGWAREVFVVDSYSADDTVSLALRHGARVVQRRFRGFGGSMELRRPRVAGDRAVDDEARPRRTADGPSQGVDRRPHPRERRCSRAVLRPGRPFHGPAAAGSAARGPRLAHRVLPIHRCNGQRASDRRRRRPPGCRTPRASRQPRSGPLAGETEPVHHRRSGRGLHAAGSRRRRATLRHGASASPVVEGPLHEAAVQIRPAVSPSLAGASGHGAAAGPAGAGRGFAASSIACGSTSCGSWSTTASRGGEASPAPFDRTAGLGRATESEPAAPPRADRRDGTDAARTRLLTGHSRIPGRPPPRRTASGPWPSSG